MNIKELNQKKYDFVRPYKEISYHDKKRLFFFKKNIGKNKKVLEITGGVVLLFRFYDPSNEIHLVDISENVLKNAKKYIKKGYIVNLNDEKLPFPNETFDVVVAGEIIEHLYFPSNLTKEINRVLKKKGVFLGSTPNAFNYRRRLEHLIGYQEENPIIGDHIRFFNLKYLKQLLSKEFKNLKIESDSFFSFPLSFMAGGFMWKCEKNNEIRVI